jgi:hypothetical protein
MVVLHSECTFVTDAAVARRVSILGLTTPPSAPASPKQHKPEVARREWSGAWVPVMPPTWLWYGDPVKELSGSVVCSAIAAPTSSAPGSLMGPQQ